MRPSDQVRVRKEDIQAIDRLSLALGRVRDTRGWTRTKVISWLLETHGAGPNGPIPYTCGRCLRRIFDPLKTRLLLNRPGKCPHCGATYILRRKDTHPPYPPDKEPNGCVVRPAVKDQVGLALRTHYKLGAEFDLWFIW